MRYVSLYVTAAVILTSYGCVAAEPELFQVAVGSDSAAIQSVIDAARLSAEQPAVVRFPKGDYFIDNTLRISQPIVLQGHGASSALIIRKALPLERGDVRPALRIEGVGADGPVTIAGLRITSELQNEIDDRVSPGYKGGSTAVFILESESVAIKGCVIEGVHSAIACHGARQCVFEDNDLIRCGAGVSFSCSEKNVHDAGNIVRNNRFISFGHVAVNVWKQDHCQIVNNYCQGRDKRSGGAIFFTSCNDTVVRDNIVGLCENGIQFVTHGGRSCDRNIVEHNTVFGCHPFSPSGSGISLQADYSGTFRDNIFRHNMVSDCDAGITVTQPRPQQYQGPADNTLIEYNTISDCWEWGVLISGNGNMTVRNNRIFNTRFVGIEIREAPGNVPSENNTIADNVVCNNDICGILIGPGNDGNSIVNNVLKNNFKGEIRVSQSSNTIVRDNIIHETMNYNRNWNASQDGLGIDGGVNNVVENNRYFWQRDGQ